MIFGFRPGGMPLFGRQGGEIIKTFQVVDLCLPAKFTSRTLATLALRLNVAQWSSADPSHQVLSARK